MKAEMAKRPNGIERDRYFGCERWSYRRWAWEFLRRNEGFIAACDRVDDGALDSQQEIADRFGLRDFKHYKENYSSEVSRTPRFAGASIRRWGNARSIQNDRTVTTVLEKGQV